MNMRFFPFGLLLCVIALQAQTVTIKQAAGWFETALVEWQTTGKADSYNVYVNGQGLVDQKLDNPLVRSYGSYWRADAIGLMAGTYTLKVAPVASGKEGHRRSHESTDRYRLRPCRVRIFRRKYSQRL